MSMKEARTIVNACFVFAVFLLVYGSVTPGHATSSAHPPRFLKIQVDNHREGPDFSISVPYGLVGTAVRFAAMGKVRRELDISFDDPIESAKLKDVWKELSESPDGTEVKREEENETLTFKKEGGSLLVNVAHKENEEKVTLRLPLGIVERIVDEERDLDVNTLVDEIGNAGPGDLVEVKARDANVRVWIE